MQVTDQIAQEHAGDHGRAGTTQAPTERDGIVDVHVGEGGESVDVVAF